MIKNIVILISGNGSNMQALIRHFIAPHFSTRVKIAAVISNKKDALGIQWARQHNININIIEHTKYSKREDFDLALLECVQSYKADIVVLAGFMRILTHIFIKPLLGKLINIHPSLLPKFKGLHTHKQALEAKERMHGASVHFVTTDLDAGPIIMQASIPILSTDSAQSLAQRVLEVEHVIYPKVIEFLLENKISIEDLY